MSKSAMARQTGKKNENLVDDDLQRVLGDRYAGEAVKESANYKPAEEGSTETDRRWDKLKAVALLILSDGLMIAMIMEGKIDTFIGLLFLASISVHFGGQVK